MCLQIRTEMLLRISAIGIFVTLFIATVFGHYAEWYILFGTPLLMGSLYSFYVPSLYSLPDAYHKKLSAESTANTVIAYAFGEVVVCAAIGYLMQIDPLLLFVSLSIFAFLNVFLL